MTGADQQSKSSGEQAGGKPPNRKGTQGPPAIDVASTVGTRSTMQGTPRIQTAGIMANATLQPEAAFRTLDDSEEDSHARQWDPDVPPIDQELARLNALVPNANKLWRKAYPLQIQESKVVPRPDLMTLRRSFDDLSPFHLTDEQLLVWLRSCDILPLLKQWVEQCMNDGIPYRQLQRMLLSKERPWDPQADQIAEYARLHGTRSVKIDGVETEALLICGRFAKKICNTNSDFFGQFAPYGYSDEERYLAASRVLLTVYDDLRVGNHGSFGILLDSELAGLIKQGVRKAWEMKYPFEDETVQVAKRAKKRAQPEVSTRLPSPSNTDLPLPELARPAQSSDDGKSQDMTAQDAFQHLMRLSGPPAETHGQQHHDQMPAATQADREQAVPPQNEVGRGQIDVLKRTMTMLGRRHTDNKDTFQNLVGDLTEVHGKLDEAKAQLEVAREKSNNVAEGDGSGGEQAGEQWPGTAEQAFEHVSPS
ncbi:hypothetical protein LTR85_000135 [Meristemomyces frigidus]|nr:hypothetical protein LTR85_000135 [Meristemomyces frigidus]